MNGKVLKLFLYLLCVKVSVELAVTSRRIVDQRDVSNHCKRRVVPSVFLGQHVTAANSQIMQFSQLEAPYSCSLSVRAEAGSNIILVIQLLSEESLIEACSVNGDQLIVYALGETFGGYWGPIPNVIMKDPDKNYTQYYTLKTTRPPTKRTRKKIWTTEERKILKQTETQSTVTELEYFTMDVPIVNVSGNIQLGPARETNDSEDLFNYIYDVTPRNGVEYETSILPLVQFSIRQQANSYDADHRLYELDYDSKGFTMDPRLIFNTVKKKKTYPKKDWKYNKRYRHGTRSTSMFMRRDSKNLFTIRSPFANEVVTPFIPTLDSLYRTNPWKSLDHILKSMNMTTARSTFFQNKTFGDILHSVSNKGHNSSVYLAKNIAVYNVVDNLPNKNETKAENEGFVETDLHESAGNESSSLNLSKIVLPNSEQKSTKLTLGLSELKTEYGVGSKNKIDVNIHGSTSLEDINMTTDKITVLLNDITTLPSTSRNTSVTTTFLTGAMVDHESWENIVQAAPVMAVVLNNNESTSSNTVTNVLNKRKHKRHIQSLEIDKSRPRNLTTKPALARDTPPFEDIYDIARLLELEDDELGSRVALRYLRHYAGPALYNLCDHREQSLKQMFLFNSSRIVISIDRMMLVLTPAQTLLSGVSQCPGGQLECQIVGTRVCIDSLNACDGVPNCGSYEIYDEERLSCGSVQGVQRSVYLAALTFLAVILTGAYIALYWLERCVPRVSDAFFVYTDSSENELLLDSIMRSPHDDEDPSYKINYPGQFFEDDSLCQDLNAEETKVHFCKKIFYACFKFLGCRKMSAEKQSAKVVAGNPSSYKEPSRMFSFTQLELKKFGKREFKEEGVQAGDSYNNEKENSLISLTKFKTVEKIYDTKRHESEINLLKFSKESRLSYESNSMSYGKPDIKRHSIGTGNDGEKEIKNTVYEHVLTARTMSPVTREVHTDTKGESSKRLRFNEELKMISTIDEDDDDFPESSNVIKRLDNEDLNKIVLEETEGSARDFMRFWGSKGKKSKKKKLKHFT